MEGDFLLEAAEGCNEWLVGEDGFREVFEGRFVFLVRLEPACVGFGFACGFFEVGGEAVGDGGFFVGSRGHMPTSVW